MRARLAVVAVATGLLGACTTASTAPDDVADLERLCRTEDATTTQEIRELFEGPIHQALHDLADELQQADRRRIAGDVLEAKQAVEAGLAADTTPADLTASLDFLVDATNRGLRVLDRPVLPCGD